jgi:hypothetical protein
VHNLETKESYWKIPSELQAGVDEFDRLETEKKMRLERGDGSEEVSDATLTRDLDAEDPNARDDPEEDENSEEYEEVEMTDEEEQNSPKHLKSEDHGPEQAVEFTEDDIAFQLAALGQDNGSYDENNWGDEMENELTEDDSKGLFKDMLDDFGINPYATWEKLVEEGKLVDDERYLVLASMKARKETWEEWSREKIRELREQRSKQEKQDVSMDHPLVFLMP